MRRFVGIVIAVFVISLVGLPAADAGNKPGNSTSAKKCQKGGYLTLITSSGGTFTSESQCTSYAAGGGTFLPISALPCFSGGWQTLIRDDGTTFASQDACTSYAQPGKVLYRTDQAPCVEPGWVLRNKTTDASVTRGSQTCLDLLAAGNLTGARLDKSYDPDTDVVTLALQAFGVAPASGGNWGYCLGESDPYSALDRYSTSIYDDPWPSGTYVECSTDSQGAVPIGSGGTYTATKVLPCPVGPSNVDQVGAVRRWHQDFAFAGSLNSAWNSGGWIWLGADSTDFCGPLQTITNQAPTAVDDAVTVPAAGTCFPASNLVGNDTDPDNNALRVRPGSLGAASHGSVWLTEPFDWRDTEVCYSPDSGTTADSFTYVAEDRGGLWSSATVHVTVQPPT